LQGGADEAVEALSRAELDAALLSEAERVLLEFVRLVTEHAHRTTDADVERLRQVGWDDAQIAEAVYITALFAFFNRVADAFGLPNINYRKMLGETNSENDAKNGVGE
jgi:alkylhydroperoxidase family enzyme